MNDITIEVESANRVRVLFTMQLTQNVVNSFASCSRSLAADLGIHMLSYSGPTSRPVKSFIAGPSSSIGRPYFQINDPDTDPREYEICLGLSVDSNLQAYEAVQRFAEHVQTIARIEGGKAILPWPVQMKEL